MLERGNGRIGGGEFTMRPNASHRNRGSSLKKVINHKQGSSKKPCPLVLIKSTVNVKWCSPLVKMTAVTVVCSHKETVMNKDESKILQRENTRR